MTSPTPLGLFIQPACLQHKYIRHANSSHIFERPERLRAVLLGVAAAIARLEELDKDLSRLIEDVTDIAAPSNPAGSDDISSLLSNLSIASAGGVKGDFVPPHRHLHIVPPPRPPISPGQVLLHHQALQLVHSPPPEGDLREASLVASSHYLRDLLKWATEAAEQIRETGCEIPGGMGLNQGDLYLGPGSVLAIEGAVQTVCQAVDKVCSAVQAKAEPATPPSRSSGQDPQGTNYFEQQQEARVTNKAFCAIRPPGHHCGEDAPSGFCYVNNVVVGALHAYLEHDIDRAIIIDFDLHHGNGTQALVMPLNAATYAEELAVKAGKPSPAVYDRKGKRRRGWKGFYGSVHDIYSYPCEDGDLDLISDASINLAAHGQYIENIHLQPYTSEEDFYERIYPKYLNLLDKAKVFMEETGADPDRTIVLISAGFDACEHEHQAMQRHDRRVPVSFFSRYTRDIVSFANAHTEGKIVSVLEGGYSDRALTSAAMGHVIGLLDQPGDANWWTEAELVHIEKATKKKRTGKIAPMPAEYSGHAHLVRTHALLAHFEGTPPDAALASTTSTPLAGARMTLRDRRKPANGDDETITPPPTGRKPARGKAVAGGTPRTKLAQSESNTPSAKGKAKMATSVSEASMPAADSANDLVSAMQGLGQGSLGSETPAISHPPNHSPLPTQPVQVAIMSDAQQDHIDVQSAIPAQQAPKRSAEDASYNASAKSEVPTLAPTQPKIILRIPRIPSTSSAPQLPKPEPRFGGDIAPTVSFGPSPSLYPALPNQPALLPGAGREGYREVSPGTLSSSTDGEWASAKSEQSDGAQR